MTKFFKKFKKSYLEVILGPFSLNLGSNEFPWKKGLCQFLNISIIYYHAKKQKKLMKKNARTFSKKSTTQENIRISRLKEVKKSLQ